MTPRLEALVDPASVTLTDAMAKPPKGLAEGKEAKSRLKAARRRLEELQHAISAEQKRAVLVVLQGRDAAGKDGVIKRVFGDLNAAYCRVQTFKKPTPIELRHDFLWRVHAVAPPAGVLTVFNRSHYEDVLVVRVHSLVPETVWRKRYGHINDFERMLTDHGVTILKFMLHISKEEQRERLEARLSDPTKNWKFEVGDLRERAVWDQYTAAYEEMLLKTSTAWAPWHVVPADGKRARDLLVADTVLRTLEGLDAKYPPAAPDVLSYRGRIE